MAKVLNTRRGQVTVPLNKEAGLGRWLGFPGGESEVSDAMLAAVENPTYLEALFQDGTLKLLEGGLMPDPEPLLPEPPPPKPEPPEPDALEVAPAEPYSSGPPRKKKAKKKRAAKKKSSK